jgi:hypothetical protein
MSGLDAVNNFVNNAGVEANRTVGRMASRAGMSTTTLLWIGLAVLVVIGIVVAVILMLNKGKKASPGASANNTTTNATPPPAIERVVEVEKVVEKEVERVVYVPGPTRDVVINRYLPSTVITTTAAAPKAPPPPQKTQPPGTFNIHFQGAKNVWRTQGYSALLDKYGRGVWMTFTLSNIKYRMKLNTAETTPIHNVTIQAWSAGNWIALDADNNMRTIKYSKNVRTATDNYLKITAAEPQTAPAAKPTAPKPTGPKPTAPKPTGPKPTAPAKAKGYWIKFANQVNVHVASEGYAALKDKYGEGMWLNFKAGTADFRLRFNKAKSKNVHNVTLQKKIGGTFVTLTDVASMSPLTAAPSNKAAKAFDVVVTSADRPDPVPAAAKPSTSTPIDETPIDETPADEEPADTGKTCKNGKTLDEFGSKCIDGPDLCASKGKVWSGKKCVCATGTSWDGSTCVSKSTGQSAAPVDQPAGVTKKKDCAVNKVWSDDKGQCMCTSDYKWDGSACVLRSSGGGPPPPDNSNTDGGGGDPNLTNSAGLTWNGQCGKWSNMNALDDSGWERSKNNPRACCGKKVCRCRDMINGDYFDTTDPAVAGGKCAKSDNNSGGGDPNSTNGLDCNKYNEQKLLGSTTWQIDSTQPAGRCCEKKERSARYHACAFPEDGYPSGTKIVARNPGGETEAYDTPFGDQWVYQKGWANDRVFTNGNKVRTVLKNKDNGKAYTETTNDNALPEYSYLNNPQTDPQTDPNCTDLKKEFPTTTFEFRNGKCVVTAVKTGWNGVCPGNWTRYKDQNICCQNTGGCTCRYMPDGNFFPTSAPDIRNGECAAKPGCKKVCTVGNGRLPVVCKDVCE